MQISRRQAIKLTSISLISIVGAGELRAGPVRVRENIEVFAKDAGKVAALRAAVKQMKALSIAQPDDPQGWYYWSAIHATDQAIPPTLKDIYYQCDHSYPGYFAEHFFPWHRAYLFAFETVLKQAAVAAGENTAFELPYWNWYADRRINAVFTDGDSATNPLWNGRVQTDLTNVNLRTGSFAKIPFMPTSGEPPGETFSGFLEGNPHGTVHVKVAGDMLDPETAARDPIFWLHHANIDRLWDAWLKMKGGRENPDGNSAWGKVKSQFDVAGNTAKETSDVLDTEQQLGYVYDNYDIGIPVSTTTTAATTVLIVPAATTAAQDNKSKSAEIWNDSSKSTNLATSDTILLSGPSMSVDLAVPTAERENLSLFANSSPGGKITGAWLVFDNIQLIPDDNSNTLSYDVRAALPSKGKTIDLFTLNAFTLKSMRHHAGMEMNTSIALPVRGMLQAFGLAPGDAQSALDSLRLEFVSSDTEIAEGKNQISLGHVRLNTTTLPIE